MALYELLGVAAFASVEEIQRAYRRVALRAHPDKGGSEEYFKKLGHAREILCDKVLRRIYHTSGFEGLQLHKDGKEKAAVHSSTGDEVVEEGMWVELGETDVL